MKSNKKRNAKIKKHREMLKKRKYSYDVIWGIYKEFLKTEEKDFREVHKFGKEDIERIGVVKFINAMGFTKKEDVCKWRTDALHLVICPECRNDFGIYEFYSICPNCEAKYNMEEVHKAHTLATNVNKNEANPGEFLFAFMASKELRDFYLKGQKQEPKPLYALKYDGYNQCWNVSLFCDLAEGDTVKFIMSDGSIYKENEAELFEFIGFESITNEEICMRYHAIQRPTPINALSD